MSFYMRFISTSSKPITLDLIESGLNEVDPGYMLENAQTETFSAADFVFEGQLCAELEINRSGDDIFQDEIDELADYLQDVDWSRADAQGQVFDTLEAAQLMISVRVPQRGDDIEVILDRIEPLWDWLFDHYDGLLQIDGDGYYGPGGLIYNLNTGP
jgi:hypothetical protein